jgi:isopenicillin N synthase-like dioxygenase
LPYRFHYDLNFLTIHGRSRFPGLHVWLADGRRIPVRIPQGCLLLQAGKQMEWLTGGTVQAGYHEVVVSADTLAAADQARAEGRPAWRVSSTVFSQIASDVLLQPLGRFAAPGALAEYPPTPAGRQVAAELEMINLKTC